MLKTLIFLRMAEPLLQFFSMDTQTRMLQMPWFRVRNTFDSPDNLFEHADTVSGGFPIYPDTSFQHAVLDKLYDSGLCFSNDQIQAELTRLSVLNIQSLPLFEKTLSNIFDALTWHPNLYTNRREPGSVGATMMYQTTKRCLTFQLISDHSKYDSTHQPPRKQEPRHISVQPQRHEPIDWTDTRELVIWIRRELRLYSDRLAWQVSATPTMDVPSTPVAAPSSDTSARVGKSGRPSVGAVYESPLATSDNTVVVAAATMDSLEQQIKDSQQQIRVLSEETKSHKEHFRKMIDSHQDTHGNKLAAIQQSVSMVLDFQQQQRTGELGTRRPAQPSFPSVSPSPIREVFKDVKDIPSTGGGVVPRGVPRSSRAAAPPKNACWDFIKGRCTRTPCRFEHWLPPDPRESTNLLSAVSLLNAIDEDLSENRIDCEDYGDRFAGILFACPLLGAYTASKLAFENEVSVDAAENRT
jgi:hypothetical protein